MPSARVRRYRPVACGVVVLAALLLTGRASRADPAPLDGLYTRWQMDVMGYCGGLCWTYYYFQPNGFVYLGLPEGGLDSVRCDRPSTTPKGKPLCAPYRIDGATIRIGERDAVAYAQDGNVITLGDNAFVRMEVVDDLRLDGAYRFFAFAGNLQGGGVAVEKTLRFHGDGRFEGDNFGGGFTDGSDTGDRTGTSVSAYGRSSVSGTYRLSGNALELVYADGTTERLTIFLPEGRGDGRSPKMLHIGGRDFLLQ